MNLLNFISHRKIFTAVAIVTVAILYRKELNFHYNNIFNGTEDKTGVYSEKLLGEFNGVIRNKLYLAVLGIVFDVTEGKKHYDKGAGYHYFVGNTIIKCVAIKLFKQSVVNNNSFMIYLQGKMDLELLLQGTLKMKVKIKTM